MGLSPPQHALDASSAPDTPEPSVTDVGEAPLVRVVSMEIARGTVLAGRYQVETVLGRGGSGIVLRAFDRVAQTTVAVKILKPELAADPRWIERFSKELRLARQLQHPNVCRVFDIGQADGHWFITMELAPGGTLRDQLGEKAKQRPLDKKIADVRAVVSGLAAIHEAGIVHRDVKPDNFLRLDEGRLVLSDFGLATNPAEASTVSIMVGTPSYMAPEVVMGQPATPSTDVWSLGVVLHEVLFGARPEWMRDSHRRSTLVAPGRTLSPVERSLAAFIESCLREDAAERPANGTDALLGLEMALSSRLRPWRSSRQRRARWAWPALAAAIAVIAAIGSGHWWRRATASFAGPEPRVSGAEQGREPSIQGVAEDWTKTTPIVASFNEHVHCMEWIEPDRTLRLVIGAPRRAIEIDIQTKAMRRAPLAEGTFALGCPQRSKRGELLFETFDESGRRQIKLATSETDVAHAKAVTLGTEPLWLPSGTEFVYTADESHAALFSIPVMTTNIIGDAAENDGLLLDKGTADDGRSIWLRYLDPSTKRHLVIHELPSLATTSSTTFTAYVKDFRFSSASDRLAFSMESPTGAILAALDLRSRGVLRLGGIPGSDVAMPTPSRTRWAMTADRSESDVWKQENGARTLKLTSDGSSYYPDVSSRGDLVVERMGIGEIYSIVLYAKGAGPRVVSEGTRDHTPSFLPDGRGWLYVDGTRHVIRRCLLAGACEDVHHSDDFPFLPVASPDERQIAYITAIGRQRLKVVNQGGELRDLGPTRSNCPPYWTKDNHIWVLQGTDQAPVWAKIDVTNGERVQTLPVSEQIQVGPNSCSLLSKPPGLAHPPEAVAFTSESVEIRTLSHQQALPGQSP